jgi:hypothetical protein
MSAVADLTFLFGLGNVWALAIRHLALRRAPSEQLRPARTMRDAVLERVRREDAEHGELHRRPKPRSAA